VIYDFATEKRGGRYFLNLKRPKKNCTLNKAFQKKGQAGR
jgi:hypothetical protein